MIKGLFRVLVFLSLSIGSSASLAQPFAYVPNTDDNNVSVIDTATTTVTATINAVGSIAAPY